jgi:ribosomal protein S15P/S13E
MQRAHSTTKNPMTYVRLLFIAVLSVVLVVFLPVTDARYEELFSTHAFNLGLIYAVIIGFLMSLSLTRRQQIEEHISIELNKIRRIYHLSVHLAKKDKNSGPWLKCTVDSLRKYLSYFKTHSFSAYEGSNALFREVTYGVYSLPEKGFAYDESLYQALIEATSDVTVAREQIQAKKDYSIGRFQWIVLILVSFVFCVMMILNTPYDLVARTASGVVTFCFFVTLNLLYEYDFSNPIKFRIISQQYADNLEKFVIKGKKR